MTAGRGSAGTRLRDYGMRSSGSEYSGSRSATQSVRDFDRITTKSMGPCVSLPPSLHLGARSTQLEEPSRSACGGEGISRTMANRPWR